MGKLSPDLRYISQRIPLVSKEIFIIQIAIVNQCCFLGGHAMSSQCAFLGSPSCVASNIDMQTIPSQRSCFFTRYTTVLYLSCHCFFIHQSGKRKRTRKVKTNPCTIRRQRYDPSPRHNLLLGHMGRSSSNRINKSQISNSNCLCSSHLERHYT